MRCEFFFLHDIPGMCTDTSDDLTLFSCDSMLKEGFHQYFLVVLINSSVLLLVFLHFFIHNFDLCSEKEVDENNESPILVFPSSILI